MQGDSINDRELVAEICNGNRELFRLIVDRYKGTVSGVVIGMSGGKIDHEEVGQQVFIALFKALPRFNFKSSLKTYLTRIAINKTLTALKKRKRELKKMTGGEDIELYPARNRGFNDAREIADALLARLPEKYRSVVVLRYIEDLSNSEAAEVLKMKEATFRTRLARGLELLRGMKREVY